MLGQPGAMTIIQRQSWLTILFMTFAIGELGERHTVHGGKQVYPGCVPPVANLVEDPVVERPFCLDTLIVTGQFVCYHVEPNLNMVSRRTMFHRLHHDRSLQNRA